MERVWKISETLEERAEIRISRVFHGIRNVFGEIRKECGLLLVVRYSHVGLPRLFICGESLETLELEMEKRVFVENEEEKIGVAIVALLEILVEIRFLLGELSRIEIVGVRKLIKSRIAVFLGNFDEAFRRIVVITGFYRIDKRISEFENGLPYFRYGKKNRQRVFGGCEGFDLFEYLGSR